MAADLLIYLTAFLGPFVQEDAAILGAVTAFLHPETNKMASGLVILTAMFCGLVISDLWKYWIGYAGRTQGWAQTMAKKRAVGLVGDKIVSHPGKTLMLARFIPGTRIPTYVAAGFFGVDFRRFAFWIVVSALAYVGVAWALLNSVGLVAGKTGQVYLTSVLIVCLGVYALLSFLRGRGRT
jgi:membrane protein DedA with SNARE-associated domain